MWDEMVDGRTIHQYYEFVHYKREEYEQQIILALKSLYPQFKMKYYDLPFELRLSLLEHTLYLCNQAYKLNEPELAYKGLSVWELDEELLKNSTYTYKDKSWLVLDSEYCTNLFSSDFDTNYFTVTVDSLSKGFNKYNETYLNETWDLLEKVGLFFFPQIASSIIINLQYRDMDESMTGYTLGPFRGTIYTDWTDSPLRYAESIVHESAHSWLNLQLYAFGVQMDKLPKKEFYSPWRGVKRPIMGIVHGVWAFSIVYHFYDRIVKNNGFNILTEKQLKYCQDRKEYELSRLIQVEQILPEVLQPLNCNRIEEMVKIYYPNSNRFYIYQEG